MSKDLEKKVIKVISANLSIKKEKIKLDSKIDDLSQDSIQLFELIMALEKEFQLQAKYQDLIKIITINDIIKYIKHLKQ